MLSMGTGHVWRRAIVVWAAVRACMLGQDFAGPDTTLSPHGRPCAYLACQVRLAPPLVDVEQQP